MGTGDADSSRGMDRAAPAKVGPEPLHLYGYRVEVHDDKPLMRIAFHTKEARGVALLVLDANEGYDMAQQILKAYDKLEGIK